MMLPEDLTKRFTQDLIDYEEDKKMPYVMSAERIGIEKGMLLEAKGMIIEALDINFNKNVPADIQQKIQALNNRILLKKLLKPAFQSKDVESFRKSMEELTKEES